MTRWLVLAATTAVACSGDDEGTGDAEPIEGFACTKIETGEIRDVGPSRDEANEISADRTAYRVNLLPGAAGFVEFDAPGGELTLLANYTVVVKAYWDSETRVPFGEEEPNPSCEEDLPVMQVLSPSPGTAWLELGPANQGSVWLMLGE